MTPIVAGKPEKDNEWCPHQEWMTICVHCGQTLDTSIDQREQHGTFGSGKTTYHHLTTTLGKVDG